MIRSGSVGQRVSMLIFSFLLSLFLFGFTSLLLLSNSLLSVPALQAQVGKSGFANQALEEIHEAYRSYASASSVDASILTESLTVELIKQATVTNIEDAFYATGRYDYQAYRDILYQKLEMYLREQGKELTQAQQDGIMNLAQYCAQAFEDSTSSFVFGLLATTSAPLQKMVKTGIGITGGAFVLALLSIILIGKKAGKSLRFVIHSISAVALMCAMPALWLQITGVTKRLNVDPVSIKLLLGGWIDNWIFGYSAALVVFVVLLFACAIAYYMVAKASVKNTKKTYKSGAPQDTLKQSEKTEENRITQAP